ncbi:NAD(P)H-binding protein [Spiractinospora alimapuensis]|uniref:NAD(P)H-binding protein n=1 Tax=Spiractinospora alimapuensis TaxID=2820884 RepID=UPI001F2F6C8B|nr:NAD(P)H-binding protein [Spiractinospora alimapuensis]QVQ51787.1 NAD(P)H-binding protein [Spiractinospora alimapuensis]
MENVSSGEVLVLGGTGKTGSRVVRQLREKGIAVRVGSRREAPYFDWDDPGSWTAAVEGIHAVYLVDRFAELGPGTAGELGAFVRAATEAGVRRLVQLSARAVDNGGEAAVAETEAVVRNSGVEWTIIRPSWFQQNLSEWDFFRRQFVDGELVLPAGEGLQPFVDVEDIAAVAVVALSEDGHHGQTYDVTGPRLLSFGDATAEIAKAVGRPIGYRSLSEDDYRAHLTARGEEEALMMTELFGRIARGETALLSDGVRRVLGREPGDFSEVIRAAAEEGAWN